MAFKLDSHSRLAMDQDVLVNVGLYQLMKTYVTKTS